MIYRSILAQSFVVCDTRWSVRMSGFSMKDESDKSVSNAKAARDARLKAALRDNLKRRKSQARGRAGMTVVTPEDDARVREDEAAPKKSGQ